jgi:Ca2+-binding RTX toxin-like protein
MPKSLLLALTALLVLPSVASAATATADIEKRHGTRFGPVTFKAARGEANDVTVTQANGRLRFHDSANLVRAKGDCERVDDHTATCPVTEDVAKVKLGNRADVAKVSGLVEVRGGSGADRLRGSSGFDDLNGQAGNDTLIGQGGGDELTGGRGRDRLFGAAGDDDLIDGERDGDAQPDLFVGGSSRDTAGQDRGDFVIYASRTDGLEVDILSESGPGGDEIHGIESVEGGSGDDTLSGDADDNHLVGNGGDDRLRARDGDDFASGDRGDDELTGADGNDFLNGGAGLDALDGGTGDDTVDADDDSAAEVVECGADDDIAQTTRLDTVSDCEVASSDPFDFQVQPEISGHTATFQVACQHVGGCDGELVLRGPQGEAFGSGAFNDLPDDPETFSPVTVNLTDAAVAALADGVVVEVHHSESNTGGYKAFLQSG